MAEKISWCLSKVYRNSLDRKTRVCSPLHGIIICSFGIPKGVEDSLLDLAILPIHAAVADVPYRRSKFAIYQERQ